MARTCCRVLVGDLRDVESPFSRLVAVGFYDGPTEGLIECGTCGTVFSFRKLDWDDQQDIRVFSLSPVANVDLDDLADAPAGSTPKWPCWVLTEEVASSSGARVESARATEGPVEFIVATEDLLHSLKVWRRAGGGLPIDWFTHLGLER